MGSDLPMLPRPVATSEIHCCHNWIMSYLMPLQQYLPVLPLEFVSLPCSSRGHRTCAFACTRCACLQRSHALIVRRTAGYEEVERGRGVSAGAGVTLRPSTQCANGTLRVRRSHCVHTRAANRVSPLQGL